MSFLQNYLKAYGAEGRRHLPFKNGSFFDNAVLADDKLSFMRGNWRFGKFSLAEGTALYSGLTSLIDNNGNLERQVINYDLLVDQSLLGNEQIV